MPECKLSRPPRNRLPEVDSQRLSASCLARPLPVSLSGLRRIVQGARMSFLVDSRAVALPVIALILALGMAHPASAAECQPLLDDFNRAVDAGLDDEAQALVDKIAMGVECGRFQIPAQRRLAALRLNAAQILMARGRPAIDYDRLLRAAEAREVLWQASGTLAEVRFGERRFAEAAQAYDRAIEIIKNETLTPTVPSRFEIEGLVERAAQARLLAANGLASDGSSRFVQAAKDQRDGSVGGFYSRSVRGILPRAIPVPITFEYRKANLTSVGEEAARELVEVLKQQHPSRLVLVGHTDVRGTAEFNMKLSRERAETIAAFVRQNGLEVAVETVGKGANEPMRVSDTSGLSQEDIYALNRRVEWQRQ
jgi:outer membrane protein OmpA-like peptidoglycan-associated protein